MEKITRIISIYEKEIDNLKWHIDTNGHNLEWNKINLMKVQIEDREQFIRYLKAI